VLGEFVGFIVVNGAIEGFFDRGGSVGPEATGEKVGGIIGWEEGSALGIGIGCFEGNEVGKPLMYLSEGETVGICDGKREGIIVDGERLGVEVVGAGEGKTVG
jgi:hypothetical protein